MDGERERQKIKLTCCSDTANQFPALIQVNIYVCNNTCHIFPIYILHKIQICTGNHTVSCFWICMACYHEIKYKTCNPHFEDMCLTNVICNHV